MDKSMLLDRSRLTKPRIERIGDSEVTVYSSPYDLPESIDLEIQGDQQTVTISFRYLTGESEQTEQLRASQSEAVWIGKRSRRIYKLTYKLPNIQLNRLSEVVAHANSVLHKTVRLKIAEGSSQMDNFEAVKNALQIFRHVLKSKKLCSDEIEG